MAGLTSIAIACGGCSGVPSVAPPTPPVSRVSSSEQSATPPADTQHNSSAPSSSTAATETPPDAVSCESLSTALGSWQAGRKAYQVLEKLQALTVLTRVAAKSHEWDAYYKVISKQYPSLIQQLPDQLVLRFQASDLEDCADAVIRRRVAAAGELSDLLVGFKREIARQNGDIGDVGSFITTVKWMYERNGAMITNDGDEAVTDLVLEYSIPPILRKEKAFLRAARDAGLAAS